MFMWHRGIVSRCESLTFEFGTTTTYMLQGCPRARVNEWVYGWVGVWLGGDHWTRAGGIGAARLVIDVKIICYCLTMKTKPWFNSVIGCRCS